MGIKDDINLILRDHEGYTGDGRGGVGDLPIGDRSTARKPISKRDLREVLGAVHDSVADPAGAAMQAAEDAIDAAERAELAASGVEYPVSYGAAQSLTEPQKAQARDNIDAVAIADLPEVPVEVPLGTIMHFAADTPPGGWLVCDGTAVTALYPALRSFLLDAGSPYGVSGADPLLPDLRGEFVRGWDAGRGVDAGRVFGSAQGDALQDHSHLSGTASNAGNANNEGGGSRFGTVPRDAGATNTGHAAVNTSASAALGVTSGVVQSAAITPPGAGVQPSNYSPVASASVAAETRPRNVALLPCIRAYASVVNVPGQADLDYILQQTQVQVDDAIAALPAPATAQYWQFTASGTWAKPAGLPDDAMVFVEAWGAGQSGGRGNTTATRTGGDGGRYVSAWFRAADLPASVAVTIGAGGAARTSNGNGNNGGTTTLGALLSAPGGGVPLSGGVTDPGGAGGVGTETSESSNPGEDALRAGAGGGGLSDASAAAGGVSRFGGDGGAGAFTGAAESGAAPGGGGGAGGTTGTSGAGARGEMRIWI
ncbi:MAG TPA: tail fiber protein [Spongiibacteraceae bacterium]|nr:tail fiber protein [Spongiibacteraceae bacterium]